MSPEKSDNSFSENYEEVAPVIRVNEITRKTRKPLEIVEKIISDYCGEVNQVIHKDPKRFLHDFGQPLQNNPEEYLRSLRFYGLQKTQEGTEYTMMQD